MFPPPFAATVCLDEDVDENVGVLNLGGIKGSLGTAAVGCDGGAGGGCHKLLTILNPRPICDKSVGGTPLPPPPPTPDPPLSEGLSERFKNDDSEVENLG